MDQSTIKAGYKALLPLLQAKNLGKPFDFGYFKMILRISKTRRIQRQLCYAKQEGIMNSIILDQERLGENL